MTGRLLSFLIIPLALISCNVVKTASPEFSANDEKNQISVRKINNFRNLENLQNENGRVLKSGFFFRSANLNKLKKSSFKKFEDLRIKKVIDLRTDHEISKEPDILPDYISYHKISALNIEDQFDSARQQVLQGKVHRTDAEKRMQTFYSEYLVKNPEIISEIIHEILDSDSPILFHCTAGRDRTGMISMVLLSILKYDKDTIYNDYLQSNNQRKGIINKRLNLAHKLHFIYPKLDIEVLEELSWVKSSYLDLAYESINNNYLSMEDYIRNALHISAKQQELYVEKFTK